MALVVIVPGYGPVIDATIERYLDEVIKFCNEKKPRYIIFSGGFTRRMTLPHTSEAKAMWSYIVPKLRGSEMTIWRDEESYTTLDNIKNVSKKLDQFGLLCETTEVVIFCNRSKMLVIRMLAWRFLHKKPTIKTVDWDMRSPWLLQLALNIYTLGAMFIPPLADLYRKARLKTFATM